MNKFKNDIEVSILITSKNKSAIPKIINNFKYNKNKHEIIIVGPFKNYNEQNLKIINSYNKPPQCHTIAFNASQGNYSTFWPDDMFFKNKINSLDKIIRLTKKSKKKLVSLRMSNKINKNLNSHKYHSEIYNSPLIPLAPLIKKKTLQKLKLFDSRFAATFYDIDLYLRLMTKGFKVIFSKIYVTETKYSNYSLNLDYYNQDRKLLDTLWTKKSANFRTSIFGDKIYLQMRKKRLNNLQPYIFNKLEIPQGNLGRWKFNNRLYFFLITKFYFIIMKKIFNTPKIKSLLYLFYRKYFKNNI
jgi:hypothetical protein